MPRLSEPRVVLYWGFLALGLFLIVRDDLVLSSILSQRTFTERLFPNNLRAQNIALAAAVIAAMPAGLLCLATAWGLRRGRKWSRWIGSLACICVLPVPPWLTLVGVTGLILLMIIPLGLATTQSTAGDFASALSRGPGWTAGTEEAGKHDYWVAAKNSKTEWAIFLFSGAFFVVGWIASIAFARRLGLPEYSLGWRWWLYLVPFALANAAVHESGHALVAWVFHHQIRVISVGPFTLSKDAQGYSFKARWDRLLLDAGGYMRSVGTPQQHARLHQIAVVAAGPVASLLSGLLAVAVLLSMPGTPWKAHWELVYFYGLLAFDYGFASLIPAGYSDGSMLLHLILWTPAGQLLVSKNAAPQTRKAAG